MESGDFLLRSLQDAIDHAADDRQLQEDIETGFGWIAAAIE